MSTTATTSQRPASAITATPRDLAVNGLVLGFAGAMWLGWAQQSPPAGWVAALAIFSGLGALVAIAGGVLTWQNRHSESAMSRMQGRRTYFRVVGLEGLVIAAGGTALGLTGHSDYNAAWVLFIVGAHFVPLGRLFRIPSLMVVGALAVLVSVVAAVEGLLGTVAPSAIAGGIGGVLLVLFGAWSLVRNRQAVR
jgi:hypothetical protein